MTGVALRGVAVLVLSPVIVVAGLAYLVLLAVAAERRQTRRQSPPFDYVAWRTEQAARRLARNQEAYCRREARRREAGFAGSVAELRQIMGEAP